MPVWLRQRQDNSIELAVRVVTRSSRPGLDGERDGALLVRVKAAPTDCKANRELVRLLAKAVAVPPSSVEVIRGRTSNRKTVRIAGASSTQVIQVLEQNG